MKIGLDLTKTKIKKFNEFQVIQESSKEYKKKLYFRFLQNLYILIATFFAFNLMGQITINSGQNAQALVSNLVGVGVSTSNPQIVAAPNAVGTFNAVNSNIGLSSGVILTTGLATTTPGFFGANQGCPVVPGVSNPQSSAAFASTSHDFFPVNVPELQTLFPQNQQFYDRASLTFQFVPQSTPVTFRYVFASEEWPDWINTAFNDVFGFFISGPGIVGEQNIAVLPGTSTPITATTMNASVIVNNQFPATCAYNAYTPVFTATANVIPCSTYTIKLIIADVGDSSFDSAVFLEENSFGSAPFNVQTTSLAGDNVTYEGCAPATVTFSRPNATNQPLTINFTVGGTATMGVDYLNIPTSVTIPAGQTSTSIQIVGIEDNFPELTETITITYSTGCGTFETITIFLMDKPPVTATVSNAPAICNGSGPVALTATGSGGLPPLTYSWSGGAGNTANVNVNPTTTTTYTVTVTDFCGTTATAIVTVNVAPIPAPPTLTNNGTFCEGATLTLSATNVANGTFNWTGPNNFQSTNQNPLIPNVTAINAGIYNATVTVNGCISPPATTNVVINTVPAPPTLGSNAPICAGSSLNLTATGPAGGTYNWTGPNSFTSNEQDPQIANVPLVASGNYNVTVTVNGCTSAPGITNVLINPIPAAPTLLSNSPICEGSSLDLTAQNVNGGTYNWIGPDGFNSNLQDPTILNAQTINSGNYSVTVIVNACQSPAATINAIVHPIPAAPEITASSPVCVGAQLTLTTPQPQGVVTYNWSGPAGFTSNQQSPVITGISENNEGNYSLSITVNSCLSPTSTQLVEVVDLPQPNAGVDISFCSGDNGALGAVGLPNITYSWSPATGLSDSNSPNPSITLSNTGLQPQNFVYTLTSSVSGCSLTDQVVVTVFPEPVVSFTIPDAQCFNVNNFSFNAIGTFSSGASYNWEFGPSANQPTSNLRNPSGISFANTGQHPVTVQVTDNGCTGQTFTANVVVHAMPVANFVSDIQEGCSPLKINFTNLSESLSGTLSYQWQFGNGNSSQAINPIHIYNNAGDYTIRLTATTVNGCADTYTVNDYIKSFPRATADFRSSPWELEIIKPEIELISFSSNAVDGFYIIGEDGDVIDGLNGNYTFTEEGVYPVIHVAINEFGCNDTVVKNVIVRTGFRLYFPNVFTPNVDNKNDYFRPYGEGFTDFRIQIFNRWGELLYTSFDIDNGWDGTTKLSKKSLTSDMYFYRAYVADERGKEHEFSGWVMLLK
jgi:gliding motility-associated-like protein